MGLAFCKRFVYVCMFVCEQKFSHPHRFPFSRGTQLYDRFVGMDDSSSSGCCRPETDPGALAEVFVPLMRSLCVVSRKTALVSRKSHHRAIPSPVMQRRLPWCCRTLVVRI